MRSVFFYGPFRNFDPIVVLVERRLVYVRMPEGLIFLWVEELLVLVSVWAMSVQDVLVVSK